VKPKPIGAIVINLSTQPLECLIRQVVIHCSYTPKRASKLQVWLTRPCWRRRIFNENFEERHLAFALDDARTNTNSTPYFESWSWGPAFQDRVCFKTGLGFTACASTFYISRDVSSLGVEKLGLKLCRIFWSKKGGLQWALA